MVVCLFFSNAACLFFYKYIIKASSFSLLRINFPTYRVLIFFPSIYAVHLAVLEELSKTQSTPSYLMHASTAPKYSPVPMSKK